MHQPSIRHFCPTCLTRRATIGHQCAFCGGPVRLTPITLHTVSQMAAARSK